MKKLLIIFLLFFGMNMAYSMNEPVCADEEPVIDPGFDEHIELQVDEKNIDKADDKSNKKKEPSTSIDADENKN